MLCTDEAWAHTALLTKGSVQSQAEGATGPPEETSLKGTRDLEIRTKPACNCILDGVQVEKYVADKVTRQL